MASIKITISDDDGAIMDTSTTTMPQSVLETGLNAVADSYGYTENIQNPDFKSDQPESESNPKTIPNPVNKSRFMTVQWRRFTEDHARAYGRKLADAAVAEALKNINNQISQVTVE